ISYSCESIPRFLSVGTLALILMLTLVFSLYRPIKRENKERVGIYLMIVPVIALYSFAATYGMNCVFDHSVPVIFNTRVNGKYFTTGKNSGYYLTVSPWGDHKKPEDIEVGKSQYNNTQLGQIVKINLKKGLVTIPWYYLEE
ncbi:hypothetical protein, partial [uncultured Mucilaginibacter sp.]|uniref:hypothetical protein n=1 Tax=uncultured Mucilaginibacter sp. TaxID=797541 RepID=UPI0025FE82C3